VSGFSFVVPGAPRGKNRPRFGNGRTFTDRATVDAEGDVLACWIAAGQPRLDGAVALRVALIVERPTGHFRSDGVSLSAEGARHLLPDNQKPDVDNALKLVMDGLNRRAWRDDVQIVDVYVTRSWGARAETRVEAHEFTAAKEGAA
jgi:Holliday junction resolvase RusA-like endonuclease